MFDGVVVFGGVYVVEVDFWLWVGRLLCIVVEDNDGVV